MNNKTVAKSNQFKNILLWFTIIGSITIAFLSWIVYGESTFKTIFSTILLVAAIFYFIDFSKKKKTGTLITTLFFLSVAFTLLLTFCLPSIFWSSPDKTDTQLRDHGHFFVFFRTIIPEKRM